jgi:hypothetical protein
MGRDIILAGIPRGGTTLACVLLNQIPNTVALNEPLPMNGLVSQPCAQSKIEWLVNRFSETRDNLQKTGSAFCKAKDGQIISNSFSDHPSKNGLRQDVLALQQVFFPHLESNDFTLVVKHPNAFNVLLPIFHNQFECFAIVRNPLAVLLSWNSTKARWLDGHVPVAEQLDRELLEALAKIESAFDRQLFILTYYFSVIRRSLESNRIVRYEDIIFTGGAALSSIIPEARKLRQRLTNSNANHAYEKNKVGRFAHHLLGHVSSWEPFYNAGDIEVLANSILSDPRAFS